jgi:hypothetical protein
VELKRLHFLFELRASAQLALSCPEDAGEDVLVGLRLVGLTRQSPDATTSTRVQVMLAESLQPLWEGMAERRWREPQLAAFQAQLEAFDLLSDYTNAVHRLVRSYIEVWSRIPDGGPQRKTLPAPVGWSDPTPAQNLQPRAWWFESCIQLYRAGQKAIECVDVPGARVRASELWEDLNGLPLDGDDTQVLQQGYWCGAYPVSVAFVQTAVNQAIIACALERYIWRSARTRRAWSVSRPRTSSASPTTLFAARRCFMSGLLGGTFFAASGRTESATRTKRHPTIGSGRIPYRQTRRWARLHAGMNDDLQGSVDRRFL